MNVLEPERAVMCLFIVLLAASSQPVIGDENLESRFESVEKLLSESSAARQVEASGSPEALAGREQARAHLERAREAESAGDDATASEELALATRSMMQAVGLAGQNGRVQDKMVRDFHSREESIEALLDAYSRVMHENGKSAGAEELQSLVEANLVKANQLVEQGRVDEGRQLLDETYVATKVAVDGVRDGETLVRSLNFANKEEEYHYELDRNDTHKMLISVLLKEKLENPGIGKMVQPFIDKAQALRVEAEGQAGAGDFEAAVGTLEESTKNLVRAIRGAGIYIPG